MKLIQLTKLSKSGQVVIPADIRNEMKLKVNQKLIIEYDKGEIKLRKSA